MSTMMEGRPPFKTLLGHATVRDERGDTMSKSKGNAIEFNEAADKMGADVMRWLYARTNPAQNINFGYGPANEVRAKFHLKLWNSYAFFVNYARLDGFEPSGAQVPVAERPDIDRWILSDLQLLIQTARAAFEAFDVMRFCLEAERFVDDKLSNWYIRRNRRRFWKGEKGRDKDAAYQTLYEVLTTLAKLIAPITPFLAELIWQNLRLEAGPESVHLCGYPVADEDLIDRQLSEDMEGLFDLVTLGSAARNAARIKVRQPLAEIVFQSSNHTKQRAVQRFALQILDELNIKSVAVKLEPTLAESIFWEVVPNKKSLGAKYGPQLQEVLSQLAKVPRKSLAFATQREIPIKLELTTGSVELSLDDYSWRLNATGAPGHWVAVFDADTQALLNAEITPALRIEGFAREIVRHVQELRKQAGLEMEDRIMLSLTTDSAELRQAVDTHRDYIAAECLVRQWAPQLADAATEVKIDGQPLTIALRKA